MDDDRIVHLLSWHQIQDTKELFAALQQVKATGLIPAEQVWLRVVVDGGMLYLCPKSGMPKVQRLENLGYQVILQALPHVAIAPG